MSDIKKEAVRRIAARCEELFIEHPDWSVRECVVAALFEDMVAQRDLAPSTRWMQGVYES